VAAVEGMKALKGKPPRGKEAMKDRIWHDLWATAEGPALCSVVHEVIAALDALDEARRAHLKAAGKRVRMPHAVEVERRRAVVGNILANLLWFHHAGHVGRTRVIVSLAHHGRSMYRPPVFGQLSAIMYALEAAGYIVLHGADYIRWRPTISATTRLACLFDHSGATVADIGRRDDEQTIILRPRATYDKNGRRVRHPLVDYDDTSESRAFRDEMARINDFLATRQITLVNADGVGAQPVLPWRLSRQFTTLDRSGEPAPFASVLMHGRLYPRPDFYLNDNTARSRLRIDGEPPAYLDFKSLHARFAYFDAGLEPPHAGDLYRVPGFDEAHREGIKRAFASMLARRSNRPDFNDEVMALFPEGTKAGDIHAAIRARHPGIADVFGRDKTLGYMFIDSTIMVAVLLKLADLGIPALPLHDGILVGQSAATTAKTVMEHEGNRIARETFGFDGAWLPVDLKPIAEAPEQEPEDGEAD